MTQVTREVVLAHGLWVPAMVMSPLAARLARSGLRCHNFGYRGRSAPIEAHAARLARFARAVGPAHFVGHSLGGLIVLEALGSESSVEAGRVVLLGTPVQGCLSGRRLARHALGRWVLGQSGHPFSPHYDDMIELWLNGQYHPMLFSREAVEAAARDHLVLRPE
ncbi:MAG: penicillin acylase family protein [Chloroflexi bacterium]|nr:penicillin acylase family protein [Chloroflexota bacterium]